jgi:hypothetical protein
MTLPTEITSIPREWQFRYRSFIAGAKNAGQGDDEAATNGIEHIREMMRDAAPDAIQNLPRAWIENYWWNRTAHDEGVAEKVTLQAYRDWESGKCTTAMEAK